MAKYMVGGNEPVDVGNARLVKILDKAIRVSIGGQTKQLPMSVIHENSEIYGVDSESRRQSEGREGKLIIKRWFAHAEGYVK